MEILQFIWFLQQNQRFKTESLKTVFEVKQVE